MRVQIFSECFWTVTDSRKKSAGWLCGCYFSGKICFKQLITGYVMINCCIWRWLKHSILLLFLLFFLLLTHTSANLASPIRRCHSCASLSYLNVWSQLMQVYFPPMNYTDHCWDPVFDMGSVACTTACITMVEQIITENCKSCLKNFLIRAK